MNRKLLFAAMTGVAALGTTAVTHSFAEKPESPPPPAVQHDDAPPVHQADATDRPAPAFLGVAVAEAPPIGMDGRRSPVLVVSRVHPGSPADQAGLKSGDTLLQLDDQKLYDPTQLQRLVMDMSTDAKTKLTIVRDGQEQTLEATLAPRPQELAMPDRPGRGRIPMGQDWPRMFDRDDALPQALDGDAEARIREMHRQMDEQFQQLREMLRQPDGQFPEVNLFEEWQGDMQLPPGINSSVTTDDGEQRLTVTTNQDGQHLKAVDSKTGEVLFDGPINTEAQKRQVPQAIRDKLPTIEQMQPKAEPQPEAEEKPVGRAV